MPVTGIGDAFCAFSNWMFLHRIRVFTLVGFTVWIDASWLIFAALITWTLAAGVFPSQIPNLPRALYWWMGVAGAIGLFFSIVIHELSHSIVARRFAIPIRGITLFIFGGVAELHDEPTSARGEFWMTIAGPISSVMIGAILLSLAKVTGAELPRPVEVLLIYLGEINWLLALFNLAPAFPLDGGRVLRSALWAWKRDYAWATRVAARFGAGFGILLMAAAGFSVLRGNFVGGVWLFLIGLFLNGAAGATRRQLLLAQTFTGRKVSNFVSEQPAISPDLSLKAAVEKYFYRYHSRILPVMHDGTLTGCVRAEKLREINQSQWEKLHVSDAAEPCTHDATISPDADALDALKRMPRTGRDELFVVDGRRYVGVISLANMLRFLAIRRDLERSA